MRYRYYTADVFTDRIFGGNPLAVFPEAEGLSPEQMQRVARELNLSETVFVRPPKDAGNSRHLRIFTPAMELPFAGHPTLGCAHVLALLGEVEAGNGETEVIFEEGIGPITVRIQADGGAPGFTQLDVAKMPEFAMEIPSLRSIASALSLDISDLLLGDDRPVAVSCGVPFLVVPLRSLEALGRARLDRETWESSLQDTWAPNLYAFVYGAETEGADLRARVFAPALGVEEDPATGAGAASLAGYLCSLDAEGQGSRFWTVEQGFEMGRPSLIKLEADMEQGKVIAIRVGGASVLVGEAWIEIPRPGERGALVPQTAAPAKAKPKGAEPSKADSGTETKAEARTETETKTKTEAKTESGPETLAEPGAKEAAKAEETPATPAAAKPEAERTAGSQSPGTALAPSKKPEPEARPETKTGPAPAAESQAEPKPETKPETKPEAEAKPRSAPEPAEKLEAKSETAKAAAGDAPAKAGGDKVVPLRAVLEALTAKKAETAAKPEPAKNTAEETVEATASASEESPEAEPEVGAGRRIGFVVDQPEPDETEPEDDADATSSEVLDAGQDDDDAASAKAANGKDHAPEPSMATLASGAKALSEAEDDELQAEAADFEDEDDRSRDRGLEAEDEAEDEGDWDDDQDYKGLDEDLRRFRRQEHYKFLWSATLRHGDQIYACVIIDLSPKAALLQLEEELAYDLTLNFDSPVTLKNEKIGRLKGEVAWRDKNRLGVELLEDPDDVSKILDAARS
ncbi:MAG: PhzF family phenazine biosynthesis isomerase [Kiloniellales bacterium]|nr:PhzF family phenazine biosynthesis isomerase [Kiloniellales bacterium]